MGKFRHNTIIKLLPSIENNALNCPYRIIDILVRKTRMVISMWQNGIYWTRYYYLQ